MARYYFDLRDEDELAPDEEGLELSGLRAAQVEAARSLVDMAREAACTSAPVNGTHRMAIEVRDAGGPVMQVKFTFEVETLKH
ncbi:hypothetical protein ACVIW2_000995 [Bradyrhizobium huanghuaihaiense]|uniref:DUF6894 domain-containing protein n=1 Tax=Bradyrhizobium huanghuaihaiense TaxID=990078 RepID=A0A562RPJ1_9BRAD|nr:MULTISPECIES: hypothetical protein [Bradyrhizobium]TWI70952.1 hypothetical protein IQ16_03366 [Bradyrhizobium huanghuaihaiense]UWU80861.1 hypothetical protein N2603_21060 [Bradyrhizobium sp. CB3035]